MIGFNETSAGFEAIRISTMNVRSSEYYFIDRHEKITSRIPFPTEGLTKGQLVLENKNGELSVAINGKIVFRRKMSFTLSPIIAEAGARAGLGDIRVSTDSGTTDLSFRPEMNVTGLFLLNLTLFAGIALAARKKARSFLLFFFLLGAIWTTFDRFHYSKKYFRWIVSEKMFGPLEDNVFNYERIRSKIFDTWASPFLKEVILPSSDGFSAARKIQCKSGKCESWKKKVEKSTILYIGGSTSTAYGSSASERVVDEVFYRELQKKKPDISLVSFSVNTQLSNEANAEDILKLITDVGPDLFILEVDLKTAKLPLIKKVLLAARASGSKLAYLRTPTDMTCCPKSEVTNVSGENEKILQGLVSQFPLVILDGRGPFVRPDNYLEAELFWDIIHLSDSGHDLLGRFTADAVAPLFR